MRQDNRDRRLTYQVAQQLCVTNGLDPKAANPAYGFLRLESVIVDGQTQFSFPVLQNQVYNGFNQNPTEQRLALQDNFVVGSKFYGIYFWNTITKKPVSGLISGFTPFNSPAAYAWGNRNQNQNDSEVLTTMGGLQNEFWNSSWMKYTMDYNVIIPRWDCLQHYYIPRTQAYFNGATLDPATQTSFPWTLPNAEGLSDGFVPMEPNIVLSGGKNTEITMFTPFAMSFSDMGWAATALVAGTVQARLVCIYRGILLQNTTNVK